VTIDLDSNDQGRDWIRRPRSGAAAASDLADANERLRPDDSFDDPERDADQHARQARDD
jgi:hypothetical protein